MTKTHERAAAYLAQTPADLLSTLLDEEKQLDFTEFSLDDAWTLGTWLRDAALERGYGVAMSIVFGEQCVFHTATPGASATNDAWLERKFRVLRHFDQSSLGVKYSYEVKGESFDRDARLDPNAYAAAGGAVPCACEADSSAPSVSPAWRCTRTTRWWWRACKHFCIAARGDPAHVNALR